MTPKGDPAERRWFKVQDNATFPALVEKPPSFHMLCSPIPSLELLVPSPGSHLRKSNMMAATFNLIATIVGGGVLSMPLALAKSGLVLGTTLMIFGAIITDFSLYLLCACARKTGSTSYGAVARHAFGAGLELITTLIILVYLLLVLCGFMVLIKGIWAPIVITIIALYYPGVMNEKHADDIVLLAAVILTLPLFLSRDLHGLRHSCYASFASIAVLCVAMLYRAFEKNVAAPNLFSSEVTYVTSSVADALFAYPIIALAFVSSFNIVEVHCSLVQPTKKRVRKVIDAAVFWSMVLMYVFSLAGYLNGYDETKGNILLNFDPADQVIFLGRIGCGICTLLAMPMSLLPCRNALLALPVQYAELGESTAASLKVQTPKFSESQLLPPLNAIVPGENVDEESLPLYINPLQPNSETSSSTYQSTSGSEEDKVSDNTAPSVVGTNNFLPQENILHYATTFTILFLCYVGAVVAPGVAIVWSICGSSLAFLVQYILPAACFIKLCSKRKGRMRADVFYAWGLLLLSCLGAVACTAQTVWRIFFMAKI